MEAWLSAALETAGIDGEVYGPYVIGMVEDDDDPADAEAVREPMREPRHAPARVFIPNSAGGSASPLFRPLICAGAGGAALGARGRQRRRRGAQ